MQIQVVGLNHRDAPLAIRERVAFTPELLQRGYQKVREIAQQEGMVILSTCNRTEIYLAGGVELTDILAWWERLVGIERGQFSDALYWYQNRAATEHLFRVASGIDSMVLGETQILGQVKDAYQLAQKFETTGTLHRVFQAAFRAGKRAHAETEIGHHALSTGYAVVELAKKVFGSVSGLSALVVGAGETAELVSRHLSSQHVGRLLIANRTRERAERLAQQIGAEVIGLEDLVRAMREVDIIVSSTSAERSIITRSMAERAFKGQTQRFRFFFDLAVPRDIEPSIAQLGQGTFLYDVDDVRSVVDANLSQRQREVSRVERIIREEQDALHGALGAREVGPLIRSLRAKAETIRQGELTRALNRLPNLSEEEKLVVQDTTRLIMNKFLNDAMVSMRSWGGDADKASYVAAIRDLFHLNDEGLQGTRGEPLLEQE